MECIGRTEEQTDRHTEDRNYMKEYFTKNTLSTHSARDVSQYDSATFTAIIKNIPRRADRTRSKPISKQDRHLKRRLFRKRSSTRSRQKKRPSKAKHVVLVDSSTSENNLPNATARAVIHRIPHPVEGRVPRSMQRSTRTLLLVSNHIPR